MLIIFTRHPISGNKTFSFTAHSYLLTLFISFFFLASTSQAQNFGYWVDDYESELNQSSFMFISPSSNYRMMEAKLVEEHLSTFSNGYISFNFPESFETTSYSRSPQNIYSFKGDNLTCQLYETAASNSLSDLSASIISLFRSFYYNQSEIKIAFGGTNSIGNRLRFKFKKGIFIIDLYPLSTDESNTTFISFQYFMNEDGHILSEVPETMKVIKNSLQFQDAPSDISMDLNNIKFQSSPRNHTGF